MCCTCTDCVLNATRRRERYIAEVMEYKLVLRISGAGFKEPVTSQTRRPVTVD